VLVTGASSGIGHAIALTLDRHGFQVFASVRRSEDGDALRRVASERLMPVALDVTDPQSIARAVAAVDAAVGPAGLQGLVNNAGIGIPGPVEYLPLADLRLQFEVNVFGQIAVIQACLPLLRRAQGRIVNLGSVGDRITIPFGGALTASKSAFASLTDALRLELHPWGLHVCLIEPGSIVTPAIDKVLGDSERIVRRLSPEGAQRYADMFRTFTRRAIARERQGSSPQVVADIVVAALTAARPRTRYPVGKDARLLTVLPRLLPDRVLDQMRLRLFGMPATFGALR
jgi:NAD(P)-dependent dehydrogenase (short-subunit alcohol dehydrogenase family)